MSSRQHSPKSSKPFLKSPTLWLAGASRSLEDPKNRKAVFSILALLSGLVALTALFETENQLFPVQRSLVPISADQIYRRVWSDPWNTGTSSAPKILDGSNNTFTRQSKAKVIIEGKQGDAELLPTPIPVSSGQDNRAPPVHASHRIS